MKTFDQKWQECVARARQSETFPEELPLGLAERVMSRRSREVELKGNTETLWLRFSLRTLFAMSTVLLVCAFLRWTAVPSHAPIRPPIELSIAEFSKL